MEDYDEDDFGNIISSTNSAFQGMIGDHAAEGEDEEDWDEEEGADLDEKTAIELDTVRHSWLKLKKIQSSKMLR